PGVMPMAQGGQGSGMNINGARSDSTNYYVDGFNDRNPRGAAAQARPNMSAMQEFKMEVSGYSAEMGRMAGGVMNMVLRSGTNNHLSCGCFLVGTKHSVGGPPLFGGEKANSNPQ